MPRKYDIAFKQDAVQRALTTDGSVSELERELGLGRGILFRWIKEARGKKREGTKKREGQRREDTQAEDALAQENHLLRELLKYYLGRP